MVRLAIRSLGPVEFLLLCLAVVANIAALCGFLLGAGLWALTTAAALAIAAVLICILGAWREAWHNTHAQLETLMTSTKGLIAWNRVLASRLGAGQEPSDELLGLKICRTGDMNAARASVVEHAVEN